MRAAAFILLSLTAVLPASRGEGPPVTRVNGIDYVSLEDGAARLGLRLEHSIPQTAVMLKDGAQPVARLADHSREADIKGLRVFFGDPVIERRGAFYMSRTDYNLHLVPRLRPDLCGNPPRQPHVIAIDPGHGGLDHGTENRALGAMEKTYTLDVGLRLKRLLEGAGYAVVMTREADVTVPVETRSEIANLASADLFVSVHFNSLYPNTKTTGVEVMLFPPRTQRSADSWSPGKKDDSRNVDEPINGFDAWNTILGGLLHRRLLDALHSSDRGEKLEHLIALTGLKCPGVLVEPAFLSSDAEGVRLASPAYRDTIAAAISAGIQDYAELVRRLRPAQVPPQAAAPAPRLPPTRPSPGP